MRALVYTAPLEMQMQDIPDPVPAPGEVVVRVAAAGICGSELEGFASQSPMRVPPLVMGHEFAGIRESDGARVVVNPLLTCGVCDLCTHGLVNLCRVRQLIGVHRAGGFAERVAVPAGQCVEIPDDVTLEQAVMIEPLANAVHALRIANDPAWPAERVGVIGAGALGLSVVVAARRLAAVQTLEVVDLMTERLEVVRAAGATSVGSQLSSDLDLVIDCVGAPSTRAAASAAVRPGGTVVWLGLHDSEAGLDCREVTRSEKRITGTFAYTGDDFSRAAECASSIDASWLEVAALDDGVDVWQRLLAGPAAAPKTLLVPDGDTQKV